MEVKGKGWVGDKGREGRGRIWPLASAARYASVNHWYILTSRWIPTIAPHQNPWP